MPSWWLRRRSSSWASVSPAVGQVDPADRRRRGPPPASGAPWPRPRGGSGFRSPCRSRAVPAVRGSRSTSRATRTPAHAVSSRARYPCGRSRPSLSTDRLITWNSTWTSRTFSTSSSQREVIHAHGHTGSNQRSTFCVMRASVAGRDHSEMLGGRAHGPHGARWRSHNCCQAHRGSSLHVPRQHHPRRGQYPELVSSASTPTRSPSTSPGRRLRRYSPLANALGQDVHLDDDGCASRRSRAWRTPT
jgi:hypothetical protein